MSASIPPAATATFVSPPPGASPRQLLGRVVSVVDDGGLWASGRFALVSGVSVSWIADAFGVRRHRRLFESGARVVLSGFDLGGPLYVTGVREASDFEWRDAVSTVSRRPMHGAVPGVAA